VGTKYRTRVIEFGEGTPLIMIHGGGGHAEVFSRNVVHLGQHFRAMAIDLLWHGLSSKPPFRGQAVPAYGDQVLDLMDTLSIERAHIEGAAIGGRVALWMGIHHPERVLKLVLNNTGGVNFREGSVENPVESQARYTTVVNTSIQQPTHETVRERLEELMASPDRVTDELVEVRYRYYSDPETNAAQSVLRDAGHEMFEEEEVARIPSPTLVLASDKNPLRGIDAPQRLASLIPGSRSYLMRDSAIWTQWEHAEEHDREVIAFLTGGPGGVESANVYPSKEG
jgi:pimeloyl-ACP methyl ester carboxylesterase